MNISNKLAMALTCVLIGGAAYPVFAACDGTARDCLLRGL